MTCSKCEGKRPTPQRLSSRVDKSIIIPPIQTEFLLHTKISQRKHSICFITILSNYISFSSSPTTSIENSHHGCRCFLRMLYPQLILTRPCPLTLIQIQSLCRTIGGVLMAIVNGIGSIITAIVNGIVSFFNIIISCLTCGRTGRRRGTTRTHGTTTRSRI